MISTTWTDALAGMPAAGLDVRPRAYRRAPEAFTAPFQGTGLPVGVPVSGVPAMHATRIDDSTLGLHSSRRPPG